MTKTHTDKRLKSVNSELSSIKDRFNNRNPKTVYAFAITLGMVLMFSAFYFGASITGFITFSETVISADNLNLYFSESDNFILEPKIDNIDALMLSGVISGNGRVSIFTNINNDKKLVYFYEGNANTPVNFSNICFETCHFKTNETKFDISVELKGTSLSLNKVTYMHSNLIDFDLLPYESIMNYQESKAGITNLKLTNTEGKNYSVVLFVDGPFAEHFSWQGSLIHMTDQDKEKIIPITINLPRNLPKGEFTHRISVRYVPPGPYDFSGTSPVAESYIIIKN